jgi:hypothetical protein
MNFLHGTSSLIALAITVGIMKFNNEYFVFLYYNVVAIPWQNMHGIFHLIRFVLDERDVIKRLVNSFMPHFITGTHRFCQ